ncbi:MAG TPA: AMP-binding protein [Geothrix sp.]|nr:AMP-binding protein [Geothrix sp.]
MLADLLSDSRPLDAPVALSPDGPRTLGELAGAATQVARQTAAGGRWVLACPDAFEFTAGLLGLLQSRCTVLIPPNLLPETLALLQAEAAGSISAAPAGGASSAPLGPIPDGDLEFWTSGSSGHPKRVPRRFAHLLREVEVLETLFGPHCQGGPILGTVPHHHIYGCLFRVLWPLAAGRPFLTEPCGEPDRFLAAFAQALPPVLVASPAHLSRLPQLVDMGRIQTAPSVVFSSGGPLAAEDARRWRRWSPGGVIEIYGSTESGGIAWRNQDGQPENEAWTPFPDVTLAAAEDGALLLRSPRIPPGVLRMEDAVDFLPDGRFRLRGRLDRVLKLAEKRVSLPELEASLEAHPWVQRAAVVLLREPRTLLGAVLVLSPEAPVTEAKDLAATLKAHLARRFEAAALPKRWRVVEQLPTNASGKVEAARLAGLFLPS